MSFPNTVQFGLRIPEKLLERVPSPKIGRRKCAKSSINSAADCSTSLKFDTQFDHVTSDVGQMFKVMCQRSRLQRETSSDRQILALF